MPNRLENAFRIRDILDNPYPDAPNFHQIFRMEIAEEQDMINELNNTGKPWTTQEYRFTYMPGNDTYAINVSNFGKPILVVKATGNCQIPYIPVPFDDITELNYGTLLSAYYGSVGAMYPYNMNETLERIAFYREGTLGWEPKLKIQPKPKDSAEYIITYLPGYQGTTDPLLAEVNLPEHVELLRLRMATSLLPYAKWFEDEEQNRVKRKDLAMAFAYQIERKERAYQQYISSLAHPRETTVDYWN